METTDNGNGNGNGYDSFSSGGADADADTIALLQEEIARLEEELRLRDAEASAHLDHHQSLPVPGSGSGSGPEHEAQERIDELGRELAARDETITLLLEQIRLADEAEAASRAEWEQLNGWVQEVERRVEQGGTADDLRAALAAERNTSEALRQAAEKEKRAAEAQRQALVAEVERLRARFTQVVGESDAAIAAFQALEHENQQLRDNFEAFSRSAVPAHEMDAVGQELHELRNQRDRLAQELKRERDDRQRERIEYEASCNAMKTQMARETLRRQEGQVKPAGPAHAEAGRSLEADQRIRALREHLKQIQDDETEQRMKRSLTARLSRLWHHTSPH
jgi:hypothetical protein